MPGLGVEQQRMKKNDIIELTITDMGINGEGIGKYNGMPFFVKDALIGDVIMARITKLKKSYGYGRLEELLTPSKDRVLPCCELHRRCGGCQLLALSYEKQLEYKQQKVRNNLIHIGGFSEAEIDEKTEPIVGMDSPYRYRNKAQFPVGEDKNGEIVTGFYAARTHNIIPVEDCPLGVAENKAVLSAVKAYMKANRIPAYDEVTGTGLVRHILIRYGFTTNEIMVCLVLNGSMLPEADDLITRLCRIEGMTSICINCNIKNTNVILGEKTITIWGQPFITDYIHLWRRDEDHCLEEHRRAESVELSNEYRKTADGFVQVDNAIAYHISPQSFYQVNPVQTEKLYSLALEYAGLTGKETVWDLYCGIGTISLFLAKKAGKVYGVEIVSQAVEDAKSNARLNHIENAEFFTGKAEELLPAFYAKGQQEDMLHPDVIVVDPPRKGCDQACLDTMLAMQPERIVYVSCDSATLARDLRFLCDGGYEIGRLRAVDQFCHTGHVESIVKLVRK